MDATSKPSNKSTKPSQIASKIPTVGSGRDSGTHSRSSSVSNLTTASDIQSDIGDSSSGSFDDFKIGDRVYVNGTKPGTLKFLGKAEFSAGIWAGVLLDEAIGKNDGSVAGVKYFTCKPNHGIFARPNKLTKSLATSPPAMGGDSTLVGFTTPKASGSAIPSSRSSVCSSTSASSYRPCSKLRVGERITVSSLGGEKSGTLRFVGETEFAKGEWAGIELDEPTGKNDGSVAGKKYFTCPMKYGLFAPLHKISRAGGTLGTPTSRPGSARGLMRSDSRDSLSSSVSNASKSSRVKLGVTSLSNAQKAKTPTSGGGIMTATRALQESIKEKDLHIQQLLKERDLDRADYTRLCCHLQELENKSSELESVNKKTEAERKMLEDQVISVQRKLEDIQFQLEEEKIAKSDFEVQLQQRSDTLKRIEEFVATDSGDLFVSIKELLSGKDVPSEITVQKSVLPEVEGLNKKIVELESCVKLLSQEKEEINNKLTLLEKSSSEALKQNEKIIYTLETASQEKEDIISNLKLELNSNIEKVTQLIDDNKHLSEQILFKEEEAKGHADEVIKELGEKDLSLRDEISAKTNQLRELSACIQEKDKSLADLKQTLEKQEATLTQYQNEIISLKEAAKQHESDLEQRISAQKLLEDELSSLKQLVESNNGEKEKKISLLEQDIQTKSTEIADYVTAVQEKENLVASLQRKLDDQSGIILQLQNDHKEALDIMKKKDSEFEDQIVAQKALEDQLTSLQLVLSSSNSEKEEKMLDLVKEIENATNALHGKEDELAGLQKKLDESQADIERLNETIKTLSDKIKAEERNAADANNIASSKIMTLQAELESVEAEKLRRLGNAEVEIRSLKDEVKAKEEVIMTKDATVAQHEKEFVSLKEKLSNFENEASSLKLEITKLTERNQNLGSENTNLEYTLKEKDKEISSSNKQIEELQLSLEKVNAILEEKEKSLLLLQENLSDHECEKKQLFSKLELAEQKVEMLNKNSSEHVKSLQEELTKLKEGSTDTISKLEQELEKVKSDHNKTSQTAADLEISLSKKEEMIASLESSLTEKEQQLSSLNVECEKLVKELDVSKADYESQLKKYKEQQNLTEKELKEKISEKDMEISTMKERLEKVISDASEKENSNAKLQDIVQSLEATIRGKNEEIDQALLNKEALTKDFTQKLLELESKENHSSRELTKLRSDYEALVKQKEQALQDALTSMKDQTEVLTTKSKELELKEKEIGSLRESVKRKESQFEELSQMILDSQKQLTLLKERNEKNEELLRSKESYIKDTLSGYEKQMLSREQAFKDEISKLEAMIQEKQGYLEQKEGLISNLTSELQRQKELTESLQKQINVLSTEKERLTSDSSQAYQDLKKQVDDMQAKYLELLRENEKIVEEDLKTKEVKKSLEIAKETLLQEKSAQEELVKDREANLESLQAEVIRMQSEFVQHKQDLQQKLDVSQMELEAVKEFKNELDVQHRVCEELQEELQTSEKRRKELEAQLKILPQLTEEKNQFKARVDELEKIDENASEIIESLENKISSLEELLNNTKNSVLQKDKELAVLKEQSQAEQKESSSLSSLLKSLKEENSTLKAQLTLIELNKSQTKTDSSDKSSKDALPDDGEEKDALLYQIDFLNSIIVDMKQKNEELTRQLELERTCWDKPDVNLNGAKKEIAPRLFCDICDMFDLHDTEDCPKQESFMEEEEVKVPHLKKPGSHKMEERPYCNNCEVFGHWTLDCTEEETF